MNGQKCEQSEKEVLSAALTNPDKLSLLMEYPEDIFCIDNNIIIFNVLKDLYENDIRIDSSIVVSKLKESGLYDKIGDSIVEIYKTYAPVSIEYHLETLSRMSRNRKMMLYLADAYNGIKNNDISYQQFIDKIVDINNQSDGVNKDYVCVSDYSGKNLDDLFKKSKFIRTGIRNLDDKLYGLRSSQLIVIAGRPGMGKSTLALQISKNIKTGVLFFSLEMDSDELYLKLLANQAQVDSNKIEHKKMDDKELERVLKNHALYSNWKIKIADKVFDLSKIKNKIKKMNKNGGVKCVFIDYLQLMTGGVGDTKDQKIGSITRTFKLLAKELDIPICLLSQLNRDVDKSDREPVLSDLRESGNIEQDTDVVIFVHNSDLIVAKNRKGKVGKIENIVFEKEFSRFRDAEETFVNPDYFND